LCRPLVEMLSLACRPVAASHDVGTAIKLVRLLPPSKVIWSIRLTQYLARLSRSWCRASTAHHIVLFDQAFVQAVCSLAMLGQWTGEPILAQALDCVPNADLLIRVDAPPEVLKERLRDRKLKLGAIERLFEVGTENDLEWTRMIRRIQILLHERGREVVHVNSLDENSLAQAMNRIERRLIDNAGVKQAGMATQICG
jgi:hypothetical protein